MSTLSLPSYNGDVALSPAYSAEPLLHETRLSHALRHSHLPARPAAEFVKDSKKGAIRLRLAGQEDGVAVPVFGVRGPVDGTLDVLKPDGLAFVAVRVEGTLKVKEVAGGGTTTSVLCSETRTLWRRGVDPDPCPPSLPFSVALPATFTDERGTYNLPPTYEAHLTGLPGFTANVDYSVTAVASKTKNAKLGIGATTVSTPFEYYPRTRPAQPLPAPMDAISVSPGLRLTPDWRAHESSIVARAPGAAPKAVVCRFFLPASHVLCMRRAIPYHVVFAGPAVALATLLPVLPSRSGMPSVRGARARIQLLRQTSVDVKGEYAPAGATSEMWRVRSIGEGSLFRTGDGPDWLSFSGEVAVNDDVAIGGFKAAGLWVKDCVVLTIAPPDPLKGPVGDMRCVVPVRLVTDPWSPGAVPPGPGGVLVPQASPTVSEDQRSTGGGGGGGEQPELAGY
ncbi:hypothetical protein BC834DRAFT_864329 [Gloeopeniophorella convolvens]|nr:hypothetical protein BC834DRAFT_864329 [Gloeopeniophorella convolvens]